jgi:hypothetical protein
MEDYILANYAVRTCHVCGIKKPQPQMVRKEMSVEKGNSKKTMDSGTVVGLLLGEKKSQRTYQNLLFSNPKRTYTSKRTYWFCDDCANPPPRSIIANVFGWRK